MKMGLFGVVSGKGLCFQVCLSGFVDLIAFDILFHLLYTFLSIEDCFGLMRC